ncbi:MAG: 3-hydroxyacyl-CoA dehydrogenase NAD-binding domain-containing protein, partial [Actinomycetota bacterium]
VVGCGVIGAAWASRMVLCGVDVAVSDPMPNAEETLQQVLDNAVAAWVELGLPTDDRGSITMAPSIGDAVADAGFVQESVPERPDLKASVFAAIEESAAADTIIASSTSGIRPTTLQSTLTNPDRLVVGHPFNPVYLLPLVEVVGGDQTSPDTITRAKAVYTGLGMRPLHVRVEIDAFIADRLLEAVWREALWLVNDGVATTEEIDDAITYGFGLRWAQMGLFETYRTAGGPGGFRHFIEQFGPTLSWPWTKLMDTPEFTPELVDKIVEQSDAQSGHHHLRELERIRDRNIAGFLKVLEAHRWGAGNTLAASRTNGSTGSAGPTGA